VFGKIIFLLNLHLDVDQHPGVVAIVTLDPHQRIGQPLPHIGFPHDLLESLVKKFVALWPISRDLS
jgi:hypothetical protein